MVKPSIGWNRSATSNTRPEGDTEKVSREIENVPQRLKPRCEQSTFGTAEAVPLSKTDLSAASEGPNGGLLKA